MARVEYRVVAAPRQGKRVSGVRSAEGRFAHAVETILNEMAADGWDYLRTETLPFEERKRLTSKVTTFQHLLVFQREVVVEEPAPVEPTEPLLLTRPVPEEAEHAPKETGDAAFSGLRTPEWEDAAVTATVDLLKERAERLNRENTGKGDGNERLAAE